MWKKIPGNINIEELQKISLLGTADILRKVLPTIYIMTSQPPQLVASLSPRQ